MFQKWFPVACFALLIVTFFSVMMASGYLGGSLVGEWLGIDNENQTLSLSDFLLIGLAFFTYNLSKRVDHLTNVIDRMQQHNMNSDE